MLRGRGLDVPRRGRCRADPPRRTDRRLGARSRPSGEAAAARRRSATRSRTRWSTSPPGMARSRWDPSSARSPRATRRSSSPVRRRDRRGRGARSRRMSVGGGRPARADGATRAHGVARGRGRAAGNRRALVPDPLRRDERLDAGDALRGTSRPKAPWHYHLYDEVVWIPEGPPDDCTSDEAVETSRPGTGVPAASARGAHRRERERRPRAQSSELLFTPAGSPPAAYLTADVAAEYRFVG